MTDIFDLPARDMWQYLACTNKTVVMYGMGNGADKILSVCAAYGIEISDFFASDGFVRGHSFHGKTVLSFSEIKEKYGVENIIVLLSFGSSLPDVLNTIRSVDSQCELYAPDVPVCGNELFDLGFYRKHEYDIIAAREILSDEMSKNIYDSVIMYKLTGRISYLFSSECERSDHFSLLDTKRFKTAVDLGAYNGDSVRELLTYAPDLKKIYAVEPDMRSYKKLSMFCDEYNQNGKAEISPINCVAWSKDTVLDFGNEGNRNSGLFSVSKNIRSSQITARSVDSILCGEQADYIKYDVEGAEKEAIIGAEETIKNFKPNMMISAYHRASDIFKLPLLIHSIDPSYSLYYRRCPYIPAWDLELICR